MRTIRALTIAASVVVALPAIAGAQQGRQFKDAWFWGVKGGGFTLADSGTQYKQAPMAGVEWLITRTHGGLYLSAGQAFFTQQTFTLRDPTAPSDSGFRSINLKNMRKFDAAIMAFPGEHNRFHPYAGIGFTVGEISDAQGQAPFGNQNQLDFTNQVIQDSKVTFSPLLMVGGQWRLSSISVFGQATANPTQHSFLLYNGRSFNFTYEFGLRYNVGSSIDRN
jgi:hypothetical protein